MKCGEGKTRGLAPFLVVCRRALHIPYQSSRQRKDYADPKLCLSLKIQYSYREIMNFNPPQKIAISINNFPSPFLRIFKGQVILERNYKHRRVKGTEKIGRKGLQPPAGNRHKKETLNYLFKEERGVGNQIFLEGQYQRICTYFSISNHNKQI